MYVCMYVCMYTIDTWECSWTNVPFKSDDLALALACLVPGEALWSLQSAVRYISAQRTCVCDWVCRSSTRLLSEPWGKGAPWASC